MVLAWENYQNFPQNRGFVHDNIGDFSDIGLVSTVNTGSDFQPLSTDWDDDGDEEIILTTSTFISVHKNDATIEKQSNIGSAVLSQPVMFSNNSITYLALVTENNFRIYDYNTTDITLINSSTINASMSVTGLDTKNGYIYFLTQINTTHSNFYKISTTNFSIINTTEIRGNIAKNIAIDDIDIDGVDEIIFVYDANLNADYGIGVFKANSGNFDIGDIGFSTDGIIDDIHNHLTGDTDFITSPITRNLDDSADVEIIIGSSTYAQCGGSANQYVPRISSFNSDGSVFWTKIGNNQALFPGCDFNDAQVVVSQPFIAFADTELICFFVSGNTGYGSTEMEVGCLNVIDGSVNWSKLVNPKTSPIIARSVTSGLSFSNADGSDSDDIMVFGNQIFDISGNNILNITQVGNSYNYIVNDVNNDGNLEIIYANNSVLKVVYSNFTNNLPVLNDSLQYAGYGGSYSYYNPICVNTSYRFTTKQGDNYVNDVVSDTERLYTDCGMAGTEDYGNYSATAPYFTCVWNTTGFYYVDIYIQDLANNDTLTEKNEDSIPIQVIDGTLGITCNLETLAPGETPDIGATESESGTNEDIDDTMGILFGVGSSSDRLKLIVGLAIVIGIIVSVAQVTSSGIAIASAGFLGLLIVTFIGLITPAIVVLGMIGGILLLFFKNFVTESPS